VTLTSMNLALFDFDGTVTSSDTWTPFMRLAVRRARLVAWIPFIPLVVGYKVGFITASRVRQLAARVGFQGEDSARVRRLGITYAMNVLPRTVRQAALARHARPDLETYVPGSSPEGP
jgi:phosphatidylglycerophosphatase C